MATSLSQFVADAKVHEETPAPIDRRLRWGAFIGTGLLAGFTLFLWLGWRSFAFADQGSVNAWFGSEIVTQCFTLAGHADVAFHLAFTLLLLAVALGVVTKGFTEARMAGHFGTYGIQVAGYLAALPMVVAAFAVALVVATIIALCLVGVFVIGVVIFTALEV